jgi:RHS repeat-associated protein
MVALNKTYRKTLTPDRSAKDSGLRFYSPEISRWLSRDPIGEDGGLNLGAFVANNPIGRVDTIGQQGSYGNPLSGSAGAVLPQGYGQPWCWDPVLTPPPDPACGCPPPVLVLSPAIIDWDISHLPPGAANQVWVKHTCACPDLAPTSVQWHYGDGPLDVGLGLAATAITPALYTTRATVTQTGGLTPCACKCDYYCISLMGLILGTTYPGICGATIIPAPAEAPPPPPGSPAVISPSPQLPPLFLQPQMQWPSPSIIPGIPNQPSPPPSQGSAPV